MNKLERIYRDSVIFESREELEEAWVKFKMMECIIKGKGVEDRVDILEVLRDVLNDEYEFVDDYMLSDEDVRRISLERRMIAEDINYKGKLKRFIKVDEKLNIKEGDKYNFYHEVESWGTMDSFFGEVEGKYSYTFICDNLEGHMVDYDNAKECEVLECEGCNDECEVVVLDTNELRITKIYEMTETAIVVMLEVVKNEK